jgi:hypothetical protein
MNESVHRLVPFMDFIRPENLALDFLPCEMPEAFAVCKEFCPLATALLFIKGKIIKSSP